METALQHVTYQGLLLNILKSLSGVLAEVLVHVVDFLDEQITVEAEVVVLERGCPMDSS